MLSLISVFLLVYATLMLIRVFYDGGVSNAKVIIILSCLFLSAIFLHL